MVVVALMTTLVAFTGSGIQQALAKYVAEYNANKDYAKAKRVIRLGLIVSLIISSIVAVIILLLADSIGLVYSSSSSSEGIALLIALASITYIPSNAIVASLSSIYTAYHKAQYVLLLTAVFQASRLAVALALAFYGLNALAIIAGFSIASIISAALGYIVMLRISKGYAKDANSKDDKISVKSILTFSGFNYIAAGMRTLRNQIGVLTIGTFNIEASAFYGISSLIANVVGNIMLSIAGVLLPTASEELAKGNKDSVRSLFSVALRVALIINGFLVLILLIEPNYILRLISHSYTEAGGALRILVVAYLINSTSMMISSLLNAINKARDIAVRESIASLVIIALTLSLVPLMGIEGAAYALLIGSLVNLILSYMLVRRYGFILPLGVYKASLSIGIAAVIGYITLTLVNSTLIALALALLVHASFAFAVKAITKKEAVEIMSIIASIVGKR
jgi:stage V sporulation protein B